MSRTFGLLLASSLFLALLAITPVSAGTQAAPEITDKANDQIITATTAVGECLPAAPPAVLAQCPYSGASDILAAWVGENSTHILFFVQASGACPGSFTTYTTVFNFQLNGSAYKASAACKPYYNPAQPVPAPVSGDGTMTPGDAATSATLNGTVLQLAVPRSAVGSPAAGAGLTGLFATGDGKVIGGMAPFVSDRAPDGTAFGTPYNLTMGSGPTTTPGTGGGSGNPNGAVGCTYRVSETNKSDSDADCLPDHWERQYFPTLAGQNGTDDSDHDGCNNRCEYLHGTDPTKADTDGDGTSDGDEVKAGTDPTSASSHPSTGTTTPSTTSSSTSSSSSTTGASPVTEPTDDTFLGKIQADSGYAVASSAAAGSIVLISLVALFGRWAA
jgi:hypothetical protein